MIHDTWLLLVDQGWAMAILRGSLVTIAVGLLGMVFGLVVGFPLALLRWLGVPVLSPIVDVATTLVRSVPGLLVIYLLFFGSVETAEQVGTVFGFDDGWKNAYPFVIGVIAIGVISCAYAIEVFRGALQALPVGIVEAAKALALPRAVTYRMIIAPLVFRLALGGMNNVWQSTIKDTSLVSVVGLQELMRLSSIAAGITRSPLLFYGVAGLVFLLITGVSQLSFAAVERRLNLGFESR